MKKYSARFQRNLIIIVTILLTVFTNLQMVFSDTPGTAPSRPLPPDFAANKYIGPLVLAPGETATFQNGKGRTLAVTMPEGVSGVTLTSGSATVRIPSTSGNWVMVDSLSRTSALNGAYCNTPPGCTSGQPCGCPGVNGICGKMWGSVTTGGVRMEGAYKYTGNVRYYYYDSICDYGYIAPSKMISNYGLPCAGDGTITQCAGSCGYSVTIAPTGCVG